MRSKLGPVTQACVFLGVDGHKYTYMDIATRRRFLSHAGICFKDTFPFRTLDDFPTLARLFSRDSGPSASFP
ncbi:hypothetical protein LPJ70_007889, partial [Coemansia sp. RSA 2708]